MGRLDGKVAIVTGSTSGIGLGTAKIFAKEGAKVIVCGRRKETGEKVVEEIKNEGGEATYLFLDLTKPETIEQLFADTKAKYGKIDVLINNAAVDLSNLFYVKTVESFRRTLDVNVIGAYNCARRIGSRMKEKGYGRIINISSTNGINTYYPMSIDYDASKAALNSLTHNLAMQLAPDVHVNAVAPGLIGTESELDGYDEEFLQKECEKILIGRYGKAEEVASLVSFLVSDQADFINNTIIRIDGGQIGSI